MQEHNTACTVYDWDYMCKLIVINDDWSNVIGLEGDDCEIQFGESVLLPAAEAYRKDRPDYDPNYDDLDNILQFFIALDVSIFKLLNFYYFFIDITNIFFSQIEFNERILSHCSVRRRIYWENSLV